MRSMRRHHRARLKARYLKLLKRRHEDRVTEKWYQLSSARMARTHSACSCAMCGNPRKWFGYRTRAEHSADLELTEY